VLERVLHQSPVGIGLQQVLRILTVVHVVEETLPVLVDLVVDHTIGGD
jgi:hypothetical protein